MRIDNSINNFARSISPWTKTISTCETAERKRSLDTARTLYERRLTTRDEVQSRLELLKGQINAREVMLDDPETAKVQFAGMAPEPLEPSFPKWQIFFPGGFVLGFMLGVGLAFLIELLNQ